MQYKTPVNIWPHWVGCEAINTSTNKESYDCHVIAPIVIDWYHELLNTKTSDICLLFYTKLMKNAMLPFLNNGYIVMLIEKVQLITTKQRHLSQHNGLVNYVIEGTNTNINLIITD